ncbi:MAG TPA: M48 family metallopeptidase [Dictyoglomaceae bacterium]|nr:M48 family metallopeptidase [Dictyoglomaceae bacterium]HOL39259.1 M48 family metallopeptidase [Dictyoglomaceae bacterium]HPP15882.1 M48 family metallopeptidase [Dictyoglomaceae bacterium]
MFIWIFIGLLLLKEIVDIYLDWRNVKHSTKFKDIPEEFRDVISQETLEKSQNYLKDTTKLGFYSEAVDILFTLLLIFIGYPTFERFVGSFTNSFILQGLLFFGIVGALSMIISLPFSIYSNFVIEGKYGFNTMTPKVFLMDMIKSILISVILGVPILSLLLFVIKNDPNFWWKFALVAIVFELFVSFIHPLLIAPLFNKFTPLEDEDLKEKIIDLGKKVGFDIKNVFVMDASKRTKKQNAYLTGFGKSRRVVLYDTILSYPQEEILAVFAHELGHYKKRHIPLMLLLSTVFYVVYIYITFIFYKLAPFSQYFNIQKEYTILIYAFLLSSSIFYFISPIVNALSRKMEYDADRFSADLLGKSNPLINALKRLEKENLGNLYPDPLYRTWYYSHPAPTERIYALLDLKKGEEA